mmetsp:Transcript_69677/g.220640  ORF Transcript_69677/g.220640 Transcript_69677/m.220640 type:complete len:229 (+) Transcript_69677:657-1343(+)
MPGCIACPGWNGIIIGPPCIPPIIPPCMPPIGMCPVEKIDGLSGSRFLGVRVFLLMATSLRPSRALSRSFIQQQRRATSRTLLFGRLWEIRMYRCTLSEHLSTLYLVMACSSFACSSWLHSVRYRSSASLFLPFLSPFAGMAGPLPTLPTLEYPKARPQDRTAAVSCLDPGGWPAIRWMGEVHDPASDPICIGPLSTTCTRKAENLRLAARLGGLTWGEARKDTPLDA